MGAVHCSLCATLLSERDQERMSRVQTLQVRHSVARVPSSPGGRLTFLVPRRVLPARGILCASASCVRYWIRHAGLA